MSGSRFFAASDSDTESSSDEEELIAQPRATGAKQAFVWSDDEEDTKRVVRSEKEKRWEEMKGVIKTMKNHKKIKDMQKLQSGFEDLTKSFDKSRKVIDREGVPVFYVRCLVELEDFVNECWEDREWRKTLSKNNDKGLRTLRQRVKRYVRDNEFEAQLASFRENPDVGDDDDDDIHATAAGAASEDDDSDFGAAASKTSAAKTASKGKPKADAKDDDDDADSWPPSDTDSSSDDEVTENLTAAYFLKRPPGEEEKERREKKERKARQQAKRREELEAQQQQQQEAEEQDEGGWSVKGGVGVAVQEKPKIFAKDTEITVEAVTKKLSEFITGRGKKGTDRALMIELLVELRSIANEHKLGLAVDVKLLFGVIGAIYDYNPNIATCMKDDMWKRCTTYVRELLDLVRENRDTLHLITVGMDEIEQLSTEEDGPLRVRGSVLNVVERLDEEYVKMLQSCDAHSTEYVDRLRDEPTVCQVIDDLQDYLDSINAAHDDRCRIYLKRVEHLYYKFDASADAPSVAQMDRLCKFIYDHDQTDRVRTRAMLCQIYHLALHDKWYLARDLMLMSHLQDSISAADIPTQIMYNRAMVQLGLCAFRQGMTKDAHNCLVDIQSSGRAKELLAQGLLLQRQHERTPEQEKIEKRRQMPFHMHINLELIECVYLVSAMLMEIPYMAAHEFDARRRMISKNFHHVLRVSDRQPLLGPPESMREHLVAASKAMKTGSWRDCHQYIINEKMNAKVWDLFQDAPRVKEQLSEKIKVESLRTYLFTYSSVYDSISLDKLAAMYDLDRSVVHSTVSKMIINEELAASMDEPSQCAIMHRTDPTRLQSLALQLSEKVQALVDYNEKLMEMKSGTFSFQRQQFGGDQRSQNPYQMPNRFQQQHQQQNRYNQKQNTGYHNRYQDRRVHFE